MDTNGLTGITTPFFLISFILISATAASVIMSDSTSINETDVEDMMDNLVDEITIYIQIKEIIGKYYSVEGEQRIQTIALLIEPLFSTTIDVSSLMVKLDNGKLIKILSYKGNSAYLQSNTLFEHPIWTTLDDDKFSFIIIYDKDNSMEMNHVFNDNSDMVYMIVRLSPEFTMEKGDTIQFTIFSSSSITRTITLEAPLPIKPVVTFDHLGW